MNWDLLIILTSYDFCVVKSLTFAFPISFFGININPREIRGRSGHSPSLPIYRRTDIYMVISGL